MTKVTQLGRRRVAFHKEEASNMPELWLEIYVEGSAYEQKQFAEMFVRARCKKAETPEDADLVIFTGGDDVGPSLYGAKSAHPKTRDNFERDKTDQALYLKCLRLGIPMLGICRGAQFLHVMNGGKLYQDVDKHYGDHRMWDVRNKRLLPTVSSVHHQMVVRNEPDMEVVAYTVSHSENRWLDAEVKETGSIQDVEAFFYKDTCCIGVQGHPEYRGYSHFTKWTLDLVCDLVVMNNDLEYVNNKRRLKARKAVN